MTHDLHLEADMHRFFSVPDGIAQDGWTAEVRHITTTGRTILFKIVVFRNGKEVGSSDISYYVDEYGQVF